jgi:hypothetical protein
MLDEGLMQMPVYGVAREQKRRLLFEIICQLQHHHAAHCPAYARLLEAFSGETDECPDELESFFALAARLFKHYKLKSIENNELFKTLRSSGTSGDPSTIYLDRYTSTLQSKALVRIMQHWLGKQRLPMLIADHPGVLKDRHAYSARGAGIQGMMFLGRDHTYALNEDMSFNHAAVEQFTAKHGGGPVLIFGFTFMVWEYFIAPLIDSGLCLDEAILLHGGGWKRLAERAVDATAFRARMAQAGIRRVHNYYGMVEQVGSVFVECEEGHLHAPLFSDVIIRDLQTGGVKAQGEEGVIELLSILPWSYPGHVLLTEDRGRLLGEDDCPCGRLGRYFEVAGRIPQAEARGCSDTFIGEVAR